MIHAAVRSAFLVTAFCLLAIYMVDRGVFPAWKGIGSDFPNYYVSAKIVLEGKSAARLYDDAWFQQQIYDLGIRQPGKFSPFPPATAFVMLPLAGFSPLTALRIETVVNLLLLVSSAVILARLLPAGILETSVFVLFSGMGLANCLRLGQLYIAVSFLMISGFYCLDRKKDAWAGALLGLAAPVKYYPVLFIAYFAARGKRMMTLTSVLVIAAVLCAGIVLLGWQVNAEYAATVLPRHLNSQLSLQDPFSPAFQSFDSLLRRLFVYSAGSNRHPLVQAEILYPVCRFSILIVLSGALAWGLYRAAKGAPDSRHRLSVALLGIWGLLVAPATATYHCLLLWVPVGFLLVHLRGAGKKVLFALVSAAYIGIGFLAYDRLIFRGGEGIFALMEYPRLWLTLALFLVSLAAACHAAPEPRVGAGQRPAPCVP